jgi:hypothetical protein
MSILAVALAAVLVVFSVVVFGARGDKNIEELLGEPDVIEKFNNSAGNKTTRGTSQVSPLVQQAGKFALYLNPPIPRAPRPVIKGRTASVKRGPSATPKFEVMATSYNKNHPELSMALIDEPGKGRNWFRQSSTVGHLLIQEVKDGVVVVKDNNGTFELIAEQKPYVSLLEGAPAVPSKQADISSSTGSTARERARARAGSRSSIAAPVKPSKAKTGKTDFRAAKLPRSPVPSKTKEKYSVMEEVTAKMTELQRIFKSDKTGSGLTDQEKAAKMKEVIEEIRALRSKDISNEDEKRLSILDKELKKKMEEPPSSSQK